MRFKTAYDIITTKRVGTINSLPSLTQQQFAGDANINNILKKYHKTGVLPVKGNKPLYGDFTGLLDYQEAQNIVAGANQAFQALPATIRRRFHNDPAQFVAFVGDEENRHEAEKLGLVPKKEVKTDEKPEPVKPADSIPS